MRRSASAPQRRRVRLRRKTITPVERVVIAVLAATAAVGAAASGAHPTANRVSDVLATAGFAVALVLYTSVARTWAWVLLGSGAAVLTTNDYLIVGIALEAVVIVAAVVDPPERRVVGAVVGATAAQLLLRIDGGPFFGSTALVTAALTAPVFISGWKVTHRSVRSQMRRGAYVAVAAVGLAVFAAAFSLVQARSAANQAIDHVRRGTDAARLGDTQTASQELSAAADSFSVAHDEANSWWAKPAQLLPVIGQQVASIERLSAAGAQVAGATAKATTDADVNSLTLRGGRIDVAKLESTAKPLAEVRAALDDAKEAIHASRNPWLLWPLASRLDAVAEQVDSAAADADLASEAVAVAPSLLGGDGPRHYFVIFGNPAEVRDLGGFMGGYGELVTDGGRLDLVQTGKPSEINATGPHALSDPSKLTERLLSLDLPHNAQSVTASSDFPTVSEAVRQIWATTSTDRLDGVLYVDPYALSALLRLTGPVDAPELGRTLTADNIVQFLLHDQYTDLGVSDERHDLLSSAAKTVFDKVTSSDLPGPRQVADVLGPAAQQRRLVLHSFHVDEQALFARLGIDGAVPPLDGDYLNVAAFNLGASKIDQYLTKSTEYEARFNPDTGETISTLRVHLNNSSPTESLPSYIIGNGRGVPDGTNSMTLSVTTPLRMEAVSVNGQPAIVGPHVENGRNVYSVQLTVPPGGTTTLEMTLHGVLPGGRSYSMTVLPQAAVGVEHMKVTVRPFDGWKSVRPDQMHVINGFAEFDQDLPSKTRIGVGFSKS
jgi:hypothetical protein